MVKVKSYFGNDDAGTGLEMKGLYKIILFASVFALFSSSMVYSIPVFADVDIKKGPPGTPPAIKLKKGTSKDFVPGQILVGLKHADKDFKNKIKVQIGEILDEIKENKSFLIKVPPNSEDAFIKSLQKNPKVKYAEKNFIVRALTNDSYWFYQWDMRIIDADDAWLTQTGDSSVIVAVVDTGVDYTHFDLAPRVTLGPDYAYGDNDPMDGNGHGTHVAGTVGATINNGIGVAGLAQVEIHAVKVLDDTGSGSIASVVNGINHAAEYGADVINLSLGCYCLSQTLEDAINDANQKGVLVVAAAGNDNTNAILYPAGYSGAVSVSATDLSDLKASYSNHGSTIELSAPGGDRGGGAYWETFVLSTWLNHRYAFSIGTSMAAPHVAGVAALVKSEYPSLTNNQIREHLWNTSDDLGASGWDQYFGYGRVDALAAIITSPTPANQPPLANDDAYSTDEDTSLTITAVNGVLSNDTDSDADPLTAIFDSGPLNGSVTLSSDGSFTYTPNVNFNGNDSFTYHANDGMANSNTATVSITVNPVNDPSTANDQAVVTDEDTAKAITLTGTDVDGDPLTFQIATNPANGGLSGFNSNTGVVTYTPNPDYYGPDSFTFQVSDDSGATFSAAATVSITVNAVNDPPTADAGLDQNGNEGDSFAFDGSGSVDPDGSITSYDWDFGDGSTGIGISPTHVYADNGSYTVTLTVTDDNGATATDTALVTVNNVAPTPNANGPYSGNEGAVVTLSGSVTDPGTSDTHTFSWDFGDGSSGAGQTITHTYSDNGLYTITLTVTDDDGGVGTDTTTATISNVPPTASAGGPYTSSAGSSVTFSGSATDPGADVLTYEWDFDYAGTFTADTSGIDLTGPSHTYATEGTYTVALRVTDDDNDSSSIAIAQVTIKPNNQPPVANNQSVTTNEDTSITITLTGSDADGDSLTFTVTSGPSNGSLDTTTPATKADRVSADVIYTPTLNFNGPDSFTFMVNDGITDSNTATISITVNAVNDPPIADAGPDQTANVDETVTFDGSNSTDPDGTIASYSWDFGDGTSAEGKKVNHSYSTSGDYTVTLIVTDEVGLSDNDTAIISVTEQPAQPTMHVGDITFDSTVFIVGSGSYCRVTAIVPILDSSDVGVDAANVHASWSGAYTAGVSGPTNAEGKTIFISNWVSGCGTFTITVNDVVKTDWIYDESVNVETNDSTTLP